MKAKLILLLALLMGFAYNLAAQAARNIPRDSGPVEWTFGNILTFIVFPVLLIVFLFFYVRKLTREKLKEKREEEKEKRKEKEEDSDDEDDN